MPSNLEVNEQAQSLDDDHNRPRFGFEESPTTNSAVKKQYQVLVYAEERPLIEDIIGTTIPLVEEYLDNESSERGSGRGQKLFGKALGNLNDKSIGL